MATSQSFPGCALRRSSTDQVHHGEQASSSQWPSWSGSWSGGMDRLRAVNARICLACCTNIFPTSAVYAVIVDNLAAMCLHDSSLPSYTLAAGLLQRCSCGLPAATLTPLQRVLTGQSSDYIIEPLTLVANILTRSSQRTSRNWDLFLPRTERRTAHSLSLHLVHGLSYR